jgi:hypothetical protein
MLVSRGRWFANIAEVRVWRLGSVLVLVDDEQSTDHVLYSCDGGANWTSSILASASVLPF